MNKVRNEELDYTAPFSVQLSGEGERLVHGFVVHFDMDFATECDKAVAFSTGAYRMNALLSLTPTGAAAPYTHWMQTIFYLPTPPLLKAGSVVKGTFKCSRGSLYHRDLELEIALEADGLAQETHKYVLN